MLTIDGLVKIRFGRFRNPPAADYKTVNYLNRWAVKTNNNITTINGYKQYEQY